MMYRCIQYIVKASGPSRLLRQLLLMVVLVLAMGCPLAAHAVVITINLNQSSISFNVPPSALTAGADTPSDDAQVLGNVTVDVDSTVYVSVSSTQVTFTNAGVTFTATLRGTIGTAPVSTVPTAISVEAANPAVVDITLDIDESSLSTATRAGAYPSNTIQINATEN